MQENGNETSLVPKVYISTQNIGAKKTNGKSQQTKDKISVRWDSSLCRQIVLGIVYVFLAALLMSTMAVNYVFTLPIPPEKFCAWNSAAIIAQPFISIVLTCLITFSHDQLEYNNYRHASANWHAYIHHFGIVAYFAHLVTLVLSNTVLLALYGSKNLSASSYGSTMFGNTFISLIPSFVIILHATGMRFERQAGDPLLSQP